MNLNDLENYRREMVTEHQSELAAIDRLIARERSKVVPVQQNGARRSIRATSRVQRHPRSISRVVADAISQLKGEFTRHDVTELARSMYPIERLNPRTIGIILWKMAKQGEVRTVREGAGQVPAVYRKV
jgi:hypothetical protein